MRIKNKLRKLQTPTIAFFVLVSLLAGVSLFVSKNVKTASAGSEHNLSGYAWSDNVGWISFNCTDPNTCSTVDYGVNVSTTTGAFSGYAWSDNIGWISFSPSDVTGCPSAPCAPTLATTTGIVTGWARALAGDPGTVNYSVSYDTTAPANTSITIDVRAGNTPTPDGSWTAWQTDIQNGTMPQLLRGLRYFQYRANFSTTDSAATPSLNSLSINGNGTPVVQSSDADFSTGTPSSTVVTGSGAGASVVLASTGSAGQGQQAYTTPGTYQWTVPSGVTSVSAVCVGGGGGWASPSGTLGGQGGGGGGGLTYKNNITVTPGSPITITVGAGGSQGVSGGTSSFGSVFSAGGGNTGNLLNGGVGGTGGVSLGGDGGGNGGSGGTSVQIDANNYSCAGGGGAGGYSGNGGAGGSSSGANGNNGSGGGGGGGAWRGCAKGGGVGILGGGPNGTGGIADSGAGTPGSNGTGALYGGSNSTVSDATGYGAVRIIWGAGRAYPSTNTADVTPSGPSTSYSPSGTFTSSVIDGGVSVPSQSGGWDGWVRLSGTSGGGDPYGVTFGNGAASGYAWGAEVIGWMSWSGSVGGQSYGVISPDVLIPPTAAISADPTSMIGAGNTTLTWSSTNASSCTGSNFSTGGAASGSVVFTASNTTIFGVTCTGAGGTSPPANVVVTVTYITPSLSLSADPSSVRRGNTTQLNWSVSNVQPDTCGLVRQGGGWNQALANATSSSGSVTSPSISTATAFTLSCTGLDSTTPSVSYTVIPIPTVQEI